MISYILILLCFTSVTCKKKHYRSSSKVNENYKISMVSSEQYPDKPAIFSHAESPVWDPKTNSLLFVDVHQQNVHRLHYSTGKIETKHINYGQVNVVALVAGSSRLLVAVRSSLYLLDWDVMGDKALRLLVTVDQGLPDNVINEGKADTEGRFWAGTKGPQLDDYVYPDKATLYSFEQASMSQPRVQLRPVSISNGLTWALNDSILYYIDSHTKKIVSFEYDPQKGEISRQRLILDIEEHGYEGEPIPDGMTIDDQGDLWVAIMFAGTILHIDPNKRTVIYAYKLPVSRTTSLQWGGPNLDELFITTGKSLTAPNEPFAGAIFTIRGTGRRGLSPNYFKFHDANEY
ncbi:regucalcin-like isoform X2 [Plodia interpunctella]|uniref:regucalcin-like isoform X2 n=1 Tax=Plodia interpunctella TaxID=58824 RepID=UPI002367B4E4|nr:regucalcin-like isoform X2 [Plodia interpunctella]